LIGRGIVSPWAFSAALLLMVGMPHISHAASGVKTGSSGCAPKFADLANPVPAHFSEDAIAELKRSYSTPEVRGLRSALNAYLAGDGDDFTARSLKGMTRSILSDRFVLMADERNRFGGFYLTVRFKRHPESMFVAWVYDAGTEWQVRDWEITPCSKLEQRWLRIRYSDLSQMTISG
jgi:hypothetical protein